MSRNIGPTGVLLIVALLLVGLSPTITMPLEQESVEPCNGLSENCDRQYTEVSFPETHNAHSSSDEGYNSIEHLKRYTTLGMGTDQGKTSNIAGIGILSKKLARIILDVPIKYKLNEFELSDPDNKSVMKIFDEL